MVAVERKGHALESKLTGHAMVRMWERGQVRIKDGSRFPPQQTDGRGVTSRGEDEIWECKFKSPVDT